jgi:AcrR family transcriptional regulator
MAELLTSGRRTNRRGQATRESMLEAALRSLASGDAGAASANRIAKEIGATWGAVKYQFGDVDGLWAAVLRRTADRRGELPSRPREDTPLRERVATIIDTLFDGLTAARQRRARTAVSTHRRRAAVLGTQLDRGVPDGVCRRRCRPRTDT